MHNYEEFERLCELNGVTPYKVSQDTGVSRATLSSWKLGKYKPKRDKLQKIADYFKVDISVFYRGEIEELSNEFKKYNKDIEQRHSAYEAFIDKNKDLSFIIDEYEKGSLERKKRIENYLEMLTMFLKENKGEEN